MLQRHCFVPAMCAATMAAIATAGVRVRRREKKSRAWARLSALLRIRV
jgi:hypothetical protein